MIRIREKSQAEKQSLLNDCAYRSRLYFQYLGILPSKEQYTLFLIAHADECGLILSVQEAGPLYENLGSCFAVQCRPQLVLLEPEHIAQALEILGLNKYDIGTMLIARSWTESSLSRMLQKRAEHKAAGMTHLNPRPRALGSGSLLSRKPSIGSGMGAHTDWEEASFLYFKYTGIYPDPERYEAFLLKWGIGLLRKDFTSSYKRLSQRLSAEGWEGLSYRGAALEELESLLKNNDREALFSLFSSAFIEELYARSQRVSEAGGVPVKNLRRMHEICAYIIPTEA